jgi:hypothetical protein
LNKKMSKKYQNKIIAVITAGIVAVAGFYLLSTTAAQDPAADLNNDSQVNIFDLSILLGKWNQGGTQSADINADSTVNIFDLSILLASWGPVAGSPTGDLALPRIPWEGGPAYWKTTNGPQFAKADAAGWDEPTFFPISVFLGQMQSAARYKSLGINTYQGMEHNTNLWPVTDVTNQGMFVQAQDEFTQAEVGNNTNVVAWFISDECDMGYGGCDHDDDGDGDIDQYDGLKIQTGYVNNALSKNDGRYTFANFGNGILRTFWSTDTMDDHVKLVDASGADKYTYTSPGIWEIIDGVHDAPDWPNGVPVARSYSYGWQADQMRRFQDPDKIRPVWTFIESARPYLFEDGALTISPDQIDGAVWSAIRHEARGISYFMHNNDDNCDEGSACEAANYARMTAVNAKVKSLAPVINTQSYYNATRVVNGHTFYYYNFNNGTDSMLKTHNGFAYIFAGLGMRCNNTSCSSGTVDGTGSKTFTLPQGVNGTSVEVVGENRTLPVNGSRQFTDAFPAEYSNHVYKVSLQ